MAIRLYFSFQRSSNLHPGNGLNLAGESKVSVLEGMLTWSHSVQLHSWIPEPWNQDIRCHPHYNQISPASLREQPVGTHWCTGLWAEPARIWQVWVTSLPLSPSLLALSSHSLSHTTFLEISTSFGDQTLLPQNKWRSPHQQRLNLVGMFSCRDWEQMTLQGTSRSKVPQCSRGSEVL